MPLPRSAQNPLWTAPKGREITRIVWVAAENALIITLDDGDTVLVELGVPRGVWVH